MNKSKLSSWTLALFVISLLGGLAQVNSPQFAESVWTGFGTLAVAAVLGIVLVLLAILLLNRGSGTGNSGAGREP